MPYRKEFFENFLIRATGRFDLNDPFEVDPSLSYFSEMWFRAQNFSLGKSKSEIEESLKQKAWNSTWRSMKNPEFDKHGVICLSAKTDNLLMWSHYANSHYGMAVEINTEHEEFKKKFISNDVYIGRIHKVIYSKKRQVKYNGIRAPFLRKSLHWKYEEEYRILLNLFDADEIVISKEKYKEYAEEEKLVGCTTKAFGENSIKVTSCINSGELW